MPDDKKQNEAGKNPATGKDANDGSKVAATDWTERKKPVRRDFPGPRGGDAPLRVAFERGPFADVIAHAKESLKAEICGALAGDVCEDDDGPFVHVKAAIRGSAAKEGTTHVTFTQETWTTIHKTMERQFPKLQIVGWYHSHPGFGVEFSEMDTFIQRNFFPAPTQIAFVTDPLGGDAAICFNTPEGIRHLSKFFVDGREHPAKSPARETAPTAPGAVDGKLQDSLRNLESRLNEALQGLEDQRRRFSGTLMALFIFVALAVVLFIGWNIWQSYSTRMQPPKLNNYVQVPIQLGDKTVLVGLQVVDWQVPPELDALMLRMEKAQREAVEKALKEAATNALGTNALPGAPPGAGAVTTNKPAAKP